MCIEWSFEVYVAAMCRVTIPDDFIIIIFFFHRANRLDLDCNLSLALRIIIAIDSLYSCYIRIFIEASAESTVTYMH